MLCCLLCVACCAVVSERHPDARATANGFRLSPDGSGVWQYVTMNKDTTVVNGGTLVPPLWHVFPELSLLPAELLKKNCVVPVLHAFMNELKKSKGDVAATSLHAPSSSSSSDVSLIVPAHVYNLIGTRKVQLNYLFDARMLYVKCTRASSASQADTVALLMRHGRFLVDPTVHNDHEVRARARRGTSACPARHVSVPVYP